MDTPGFITPPPGLVPPRADTDTRTERMPPRAPALPVFNPPGAQSQPGQDAARPTWLIVLPTGARVPVNGVLLVGRNPLRFPPWTSAELLPIDDPARSVSKTHAVLETVGEGIRVTDLHSTNGVSLVDESGTPSALVPGVAAAVPADSTVLFGSYRTQIVTA